MAQTEELVVLRVDRACAPVARALRGRIVDIEEPVRPPLTNTASTPMFDVQSNTGPSLVSVTVDVTASVPSVNVPSVDRLHLAARSRWPPDPRRWVVVDHAGRRRRRGLVRAPHGESPDQHDGADHIDPRPAAVSPRQALCWFIPLPTSSGALSPRPGSFGHCRDRTERYGVTGISPTRRMGRASPFRGPGGSRSPDICLVSPGQPYGGGCLELVETRRPAHSLRRPRVPRPAAGHRHRPRGRGRGHQDGPGDARARQRPADRRPLCPGRRQPRAGGRRVDGHPFQLPGSPPPRWTREMATKRPITARRTRTQRSDQGGRGGSRTPDICLVSGALGP